LRQSGSKNIENLAVKLTIDQVQAGTSYVTIPASGSAEVRFDLPGSRKGFLRAVVSFADFPVSFDNEFYVALNLADKIKIVEIKETRLATSVEKVFGNEQVFSTQSFHISSIQYPAVQEADLVVLNGLNQVENSLAAALQNFLKNAGTLVVIPGINPDILSFQKVLPLPLKLVDETGLQEIARPDFTNPFFEDVFEERTRQLAMPKGRVRWEWGADRSAILRTFDGRPFVSRLQSGNTYLLAAPLQPEFTTFDSHALFVPIMYKIAASARKEPMQLYSTLRQDFISLRADSIVGEEPVKLVGKQEVVPSQRRLNKNLQLELPRFSMERGFYEVIAQQDTLALVAINQSSEESVLIQLKTEEIRKFFNGKVSFFEASEPGAFGNEIKERYLGKPLWKYALMLALTFLLIEVLLVRFLK